MGQGSQGQKPGCITQFKKQDLQSHNFLVLTDKTVESYLLWGAGGGGGET